MGLQSMYYVIKPYVFVSGAELRSKARNVLGRRTQRKLFRWLSNDSSAVMWCGLGEEVTNFLLCKYSQMRHIKQSLLFLTIYRLSYVILGQCWQHKIYARLKGVIVHWSSGYNCQVLYALLKLLDTLLVLRILYLYFVLYKTPSSKNGNYECY